MSQLVAAVADQQPYYDGLFGVAHERALPPEYRTLPGVQDLCWRAYAHVEALWPEDVATLGKRAVRKPQWREETADGQPYVVVQMGWIWVGQVAPRVGVPGGAAK
ncbi:hypothetical protein [Hymenobacter sp. HDW8]|uniref:hypothetical protein n=1 Tax=Hymenobacter sp. HDW8 TaxID=2714932 RepID=UPI00140C1773|nr:hypothetical protein [Hymenobacter sp. HDW8]QIL78362.1 hypothetical protein G7064_21340 [Hymenobacter sp. HDW8]